MFMKRLTHLRKVTISERGGVEWSMRIDHSDGDLL